MAKKTKNPVSSEMNVATVSGEISDSEAAILAQMLGMNEGDEIHETKEVPFESLLPDADLEAAVAEAEKIESTKAMYEEIEKETASVTATADIPTTSEVASKGAKKKKPASAEPKPPKEPEEHRMTYSMVGKTGFSKLIVSKFGGGVDTLLQTDKHDAALTPEALGEKIKEVLNRIDACNQIKVQQKVVMLLSFFGKGGKLNEVMKRTFDILAKEGKITTGDKGNLQTNLREKYSVGTARAQAAQMFTLLPMLDICKREKGMLTLNEDSEMFFKAKAALPL